MWILSILPVLVGPIIIIGLIVFFARRKGENTNPSQKQDLYAQLALSKEDAVSQWFLLLSVFFLGVTLLTINRDLGDPISWRTVLFLTSAIGLIITYYFKVISTLIFSLIGIVSWWSIQAMHWIQNKDIQTSSILAGLTFIALLLYLLGHYHDKVLKYKRFAFVYLILGIIFITGTLFIFSSKLGLGMLTQMTKGVSFFTSWEISVSLLIFIPTLIGLIIYSISKKLIIFAEGAAISIIAILFGIIAFFPQQEIFVQTSNYLGRYSVSSELSANGILWAIIFNFAVFFELLGLIFSGYIRREEWLINIGTFFLFILIIVKYFDWFFTFLDKSLFFIGAGVLLFAVGWFMEKSRKYMISSIKIDQQKT